MVSAVLFVMLAVVYCLGFRRRGEPLAVALLHDTLVLAAFAYVGFSMFVLDSLAERLAC